MSAPDLEFVAYGTPGPQGSKNYMGIHGGRSVLVESSAKVKPWRAAVCAACLAITGRRGWVPLDGPLLVEMVFTVAKPVRAPKRRRTWPATAPDLSKLLRATEDAITTARGWKDDGRVVEFKRLAKVYPGEGVDALLRPGVVVRVWLIRETQDD